MAVVIPADRYRSMERSRERLFEMVDQIRERNVDVPDEVVEREVARAVKEARAELRNQAAREG